MLRGQLRNGTQRGLDIGCLGKRPWAQAHRTRILRSLRLMRQSGAVPTWTARDVGPSLQLIGDKNWIYAAQVE